MKSPMITNMPELTPETPEVGKKNGYTDLQVLSSAAGYYVGTMYEEYDEKGECIWQEPGSRDSGYFRTEEQAAGYLKLMETFETGGRDHP